MMEQLTSALKSALQQKQDLQAVVTALESIAPTTQDRQEQCKLPYKLSCTLSPPPPPPPPFILGSSGHNHILARE